MPALLPESSAYPFAVISGGETVADYPDDNPYPSRLLLGFVESRPLHVVVAWDAGTGTCIIVTAYEPQPEQWEPGFRKRREP
jgi:hypothetical protein